MTSDSNIGFAFCWYEADEWEKLKQTAVDSEILDDSYEEWKSNANSAIKTFKAQGLEITKIAMRMDEFNAWCLENNSENNSEARSSYAAKKLRERKRET